MSGDGLYDLLDDLKSVQGRLDSEVWNLKEDAAAVDLAETAASHLGVAIDYVGAAIETLEELEAVLP